MKKKIFSSFILISLSSVLFFLFNFLLAKILGAYNYGEIVYYLSFINIIMLVTGLNHPSLYMGNKITNNDIKTFSIFFTIETMLFIVIFIPAYLIISIYISEIKIIFLLIFIGYLSTIVFTIGIEFNANKKIIESILLSTFIPRFVLMIIFLIFIYFNLGNSLNYLYIFAFSNMLIVIYGIVKLKPKFYIKKEFFSRAWKFYLLGLLGTSFKPLANILQKEFYGYKEVANLSIALLILAGFYLIGTVLVKFILPKIHEAWREKDLITIEELYRNNTKLEVLLISPLVMFVLVNIDYFVMILGNSYSLLPTYLYILMIAYLPDMVTGITGNLLRATENEKYEIYNELLVLISGLSMIYLFRENDFGIVIAIAISTLLYSMAKFLEVYFILNIKPFELLSFLKICFFMSMIFLLFKVIFFIKILSLKLGLSILSLIFIYFIVIKYIKRTKLLKGFE